MLRTWRHHGMETVVLDFVASSLIARRREKGTEDFRVDKFVVTLCTVMTCYFQNWTFKNLAVGYNPFFEFCFFVQWAYAYSQENMPLFINNQTFQWRKLYCLEDSKRRQVGSLVWTMLRAVTHRQMAWLLLLCYCSQQAPIQLSMFPLNSLKQETIICWSWIKVINIYIYIYMCVVLLVWLQLLYQFNWFNGFKAA